MKKSLPLELQKVWKNMWFGGNSREWRNSKFLCMDYERELLRELLELSWHGNTHCWLSFKRETVVDDEGNRTVWDIGLK